MAKHLKLKIKNTQLANATDLDKLKERLEKKPVSLPKPPQNEPKVPVSEKEKAEPLVAESTDPQTLSSEPVADPADAAPKIKAKAKSSFTPGLQKEEESLIPQFRERSVSLATAAPGASAPIKERLGPTGRHVNDLLKKATEQKEAAIKEAKEKRLLQARSPQSLPLNKRRPGAPSSSPPSSQTAKDATAKTSTDKDDKNRTAKKARPVRDFKDVKPSRSLEAGKGFDARDRAGLRAEEDEAWRAKRRGAKATISREEEYQRPTSLCVRLPITVKDLAAAMKYKASELIQRLFLQNMTYTLNDYLEDETAVQYLGQEFGCDITIDTSEETRIRITAERVNEEIANTDPSSLIFRPPVVAFMGHVDHGKTSLIDAIRKSNRVADEAGAITQHIGAFMCQTAVGPITILDTPGHEAFSAMRARGAEVTDIVVLVVAGDEGLREQTKEALQHAKLAGVTIVVAINKCDKPNFNVETVYRELSEVELLPEAWGGQTITVNTSAVTGQGIPQMLEMLALQAEMLELKANPNARARGTVLESEMHKGMGCVATVLVQNGTLHCGDALVFERHYGRVKTMHNDLRQSLQSAGPSFPVEITGLSGLPSAGDPFIVVKSEKEAKHIVEQREVGHSERLLRLRKGPALDSLLEQAQGKKTLNLIIRSDVQGSTEALKTSLLKIQSDKADLNIVFTGVGEISESDAQLAAASHSVILGFHTNIEPHAATLIKDLGLTVIQHDVIYHAIDDVKRLMTGLLDRIEEERNMGTAEVRAVFKSSNLGFIAGCMVLDGIIVRNHHVRVIRNKAVVWNGFIASLKRNKDDVKEVKKDFECGIVLQGFDGFQPGDLLQTYEITYKQQEL